MSSSPVPAGAQRDSHGRGEPRGRPGPVVGQQRVDLPVRLETVQLVRRELRRRSAARQAAPTPSVAPMPARRFASASRRRMGPRRRLPTPRRAPSSPPRRRTRPRCPRSRAARLGRDAHRDHRQLAERRLAVHVPVAALRERRQGWSTSAGRRPAPTRLRGQTSARRSASPSSSRRQPESSTRTSRQPPPSRVGHGGGGRWRRRWWGGGRFPIWRSR